MTMRTRGSTRTAAGPADAGPEKPEYRVEALAKGLRILSLFSEQRPTWRIADIVTATGIPMPTVYRVVMTLAGEGFLEHLPNGDYRPGVRVLTLGTASLRSLDLVELATPRLQELAASTGETVNLSVLDKDRVLYLVRIRNSDLVTWNIQVGSTLPAAHTSIGKLLLAYLEDEDLRAIITPDSFGRDHGPNARESLEELLVELAVIRAQGWATQDEELAPVRDATGKVIAGANIAVQARDWSAQRIVRELKPQIEEACRGISGLLGYAGGDQ
jgi:IclR family pca regulon transcriptional regulator